MGIEIGLLSAAVGAAGTVVSVIQSGKAARARREAQAIQSAGEEVRNRLARRKAAREERVRRARLVSQAVSAGAAGSSGLIGAQSSLGASFGAAVAAQTTQTRTAQGVSAALQREARAISRAKFAAGLGDVFDAGADFIGEIDRIS